ncbi:MAG: peptidylprolyl isomerase [Methanobrevibacter sp.]|jgi:peptidylprolyl isomerase/FKBP-type peptidyl-prolyl cis-trans isomerase SlyD|nr:peptidylprolyl isomerase [Candidatus Methanovirga procula]
MVENGDFVRVDLTGKIKETGEVFETTHEDVAKEAGVYNEQKIYVPMPVVVGGGHFLDAIDQALVGMRDGESKHVEIQPEYGFGERSSQAIKMIPLKEFKKANIKPVPGMPINIGYNEGKVLTVNGGRVKVDFNHTFAGKTLEYDLHIVEVIEDDEGKVKSMIELHYPQQPKFDLDKTEVSIGGKTVTIKLDKIANYNNDQTQFAITQAKMRTSKDIWENMDIEKVEFVESFEKPPEEVVSEDGSETSTSEIPSSEEAE